MKQYTLFLLAFFLSCSGFQKKQKQLHAADSTAGIDSGSNKLKSYPLALSVLKDSFTANGNKYEVYTFTAHDSTATDSLFVVRQINGKRTPVLTIEDANNNNCDWHSDVNSDGYTDFQIKYRFSNEAYLYNPSANEFNSKAVEIAPDTRLLDSSKKIFCCKWWTKTAAFSSSLYTFVADTPYTFYKYDVIAQDYPNQFSIRKIPLYKCKNGNADSMFFVKLLRLETDIDPDNYSYFWEKNWHNLISGK